MWQWISFELTRLTTIFEDEWKYQIAWRKNFKEKESAASCRKISNLFVVKKNKSKDIQNIKDNNETVIKENDDNENKKNYSIQLETSSIMLKRVEDLFDFVNLVAT